MFGTICQGPKNLSNYFKHMCILYYNKRKNDRLNKASHIQAFLEFSVYERVILTSSTKYTVTKGDARRFKKPKHAWKQIIDENGQVIYDKEG